MESSCFICIRSRLNNRIMIKMIEEYNYDGPSPGKIIAYVRILRTKWEIIIFRINDSGFDRAYARTQISWAQRIRIRSLEFHNIMIVVTIVDMVVNNGRGGHNSTQGDSVHRAGRDHGRVGRHRS
ncbi:unnamed protein product [Gordionus sp. m RMFG-2023]